MPETLFRFKKFAINQDKCAMKVGTDAVLLGAWVQINQEKNILDIGTGSGVIAIMLAQKSQAAIDAIDIQEESFIQAQQNSASCPWNKRISVFHSSIQNFVKQRLRRYDLIVSNPPYFFEASKPSEAARSTARHMDNALSPIELISGTKDLLQVNGKACIILPYTEGLHFIDLAEKNHLYCTKLLEVKTKSNKPIKRLLMQFEFKQRPRQVDTLIILDEDLRYTENYINLTREFYLGLKEFRSKAS